MDKPKQVIVVRKDLNMRKGKIAAQVAHASLKAIIDSAKRGMSEGRIVLSFDPESPVGQWLFGTSFTKICVYVESEKELDMLQANAELAGLPNALIIDSGRTEFKGVPTKTCLAIGPDFSDKIDLITGSLPLL